MTIRPPSEVIKLIFDDKDKVIGIQPIKLQTQGNNQKSQNVSKAKFK